MRQTASGPTNGRLSMVLSSSRHPQCPLRCARIVAIAGTFVSSPYDTSRSSDRTPAAMVRWVDVEGPDQVQLGHTVRPRTDVDAARYGASIFEIVVQAIRWRCHHSTVAPYHRSNEEWCPRGTAPGIAKGASRGASLNNRQLDTQHLEHPERRPSRDDERSSRWRRGFKTDATHLAATGIDATTRCARKSPRGEGALQHPAPESHTVEPSGPPMWSAASPRMRDTECGVHLVAEGRSAPMGSPR